MSPSPRYAVYWAPEAARHLWQAGREWLGRDPSDASFQCTPRDATDNPRRYGFHATLKAPLVLRDGASEHDFIDAVVALARRTPRFAMPRLAVQSLAGFIALRPVQPVPAEHPLRRLADACVRELDAWRRAPTDEELKQRVRLEELAADQQVLLGRWGYAHVFDRWRFHMTLSNALPLDASGEALRERLLSEATSHFARALDEPLVCESISVFAEPSPRAPFVLAHRIPLAP